MWTHDQTRPKELTETSHKGDLQRSVIQCLAYYDVFNCPLKQSEIHRNLSINLTDKAALDKTLSALIQQGLIRSFDGYYALEHQDIQTIVANRKAGEKNARRYMPLAKFICHFIGLFPFVQAVFISGTLAKGYMDKHTDIDYFIITRPGNLWTAKLFLTLFKKTLLLNSYKFFCINYFIDSDHLVIPDQNLFTATELAYLVPVYNKALCHNFILANQWIGRFLPNHSCAQLNNHVNHPVKSKGFAEIVLSVIEKPLERFSFNRFNRYVRKKYQHWDRDEMELAFRSAEHVSKYHPNNFQQKVLQGMEERLLKIERKFILKARSHDTT